MWFNLDVLFGFLLFDEFVSMCMRLRSLFKSLWRSNRCKIIWELIGSEDKKGYCELCDVNYVGIDKYVVSI